MIRIFYHNDLDGRCSASVCKNFIVDFMSTEDDEFKLYPMSYDTQFPINDIDIVDDVYILDFSIDPAALVELNRKANRVVWIDHHKSAIEKTEAYLKEEQISAQREQPIEIDGLRDVERAGCRLTWDYFLMLLEDNTDLPRSKTTSDYRLPNHIRHIEDKDLFRFRYVPSKPFGLGLESLYSPDEQFGVLDHLWHRWRNQSLKVYQGEYMENITLIQEKGEIVLKTRKNNAKIMIKATGQTGSFEGYKTFFVNAMNSGLIGGLMLEQEGVELAMTWYLKRNNKVLCTLYSNGEIDCSILAGRYGGGGHVGAAGFHVEPEIFFSEVLNIK